MRMHGNLPWLSTTFFCVPTFVIKWWADDVSGLSISIVIISRTDSSPRRDITLQSTTWAYSTPLAHLRPDKTMLFTARANGSTPVAESADAASFNTRLRLAADTHVEDRAGRRLRCDGFHHSTTHTETTPWAGVNALRPQSSYNLYVSALPIIAPWPLFRHFLRRNDANELRI